AGGRGSGQVVPLAGRRLRGVVRRLLGRHHPRQAEDHPADGGRAHVQHGRAGGEGGPHRRSVREAPHRTHRDPRRSGAAVVPRRHRPRLPPPPPPPPPTPPPPAPHLPPL